MKLFTALIIALILISFAAQAQSFSASPNLSEIRKATLYNLPDMKQPVTLLNGRWEGKPYVEGGAERQTVELIDGLFLTGDIDRNGTNDAIAFFAFSSGGTGVDLIMALFTREGRLIKNRVTISIGDRVQIREARIDTNGSITLCLVQTGERDAMCCPGELVSRTWEWDKNTLIERMMQSTGRLSLKTIEAKQWRLTNWDAKIPIDTSIIITMTCENNRIQGIASCNRYFAPVNDGSSPGDITVGSAGSTKMICSPESMAVEDRYLALLASVNRIGFYNGKLFLGYVHNETHGILLFK